MKIGHNQAGGTLIEMVVAIVVISIALTGILSAINSINRNSVDPVLQLQGIIFSESMLEELQRQAVKFEDLQSANWDALQARYPQSPTIQAMQAQKFQMQVDVYNHSIFENVDETQSRRIVATCQHPGLKDTPIVLATYRLNIRQPNTYTQLEVPFNAL